MASPVVIPQLAWEAMLTELVGVGNLWNGALLLLFKNNAVLGPQTVLGDLTECDFTGYATSAGITWGTPGFLPDGTALVTGDVKTFRVGVTPTVFNTVYGWAVVDAGKNVLFFARKLDAPVVLSGPGQIIEVLPAYPAYFTV